jgi:hypothetical protein
VDFACAIRPPRGILPGSLPPGSRASGTSTSPTPLSTQKSPERVAGWREWVALPDLSVPAIKAKLDTGARTSALHAFDLQVVERAGIEYADFEVHPDQDSTRGSVRARVRIQDWRRVRSSNGQTQLRPLIHTTIDLLGERWEIDLTLTNRDEMGFRLLLGRQALRRRLLVDSGTSYLGATRMGPRRSSKKPPRRRRL